MYKPSISVLVPIYKVENFIERCARSLFEQTYKSIEFIFVNDCTPDHSIDILKTTINAYPDIKDRVQILNHEQNKGLAAARNTAVAAASGDFVWHVDSDDYVDVTAVEKLIMKQQYEDSDIVFMDIFREGRNYKYKITRDNFANPKDWTLAFLSRKSFVSVWGGIIRKSLYEDNSIEEFPGINMGEDYQTLPRLTYYAKKITVLHEPLYHYVMLNDSSFSNSFSKTKSEQYWQSANVLLNFFSNKGSEYLDALEEGRVNICLEMLRGCTRTKGNNVDFRHLKDKLNSLKPNAFKHLSMPYKVLSKIDNYAVMHWYVKILGGIKRLFLT